MLLLGQLWLRRGQLWLQTLLLAQLCLSGPAHLVPVRLGDPLVSVWVVHIEAGVWTHQNVPLPSGSTLLATLEVCLARFVDRTQILGFNCPALAQRRF